MGCISCCFSRFLNKKDIIQQASITFKFLDINNDQIIYLQSVSNNWNGKYGKTFASIIFRQVDINRDNKITFSQWIEFWTALLDIKYSPGQIKTASMRKGQFTMNFQKLNSKAKNLNALFSSKQIIGQTMEQVQTH